MAKKAGVILVNTPHSWGNKGAQAPNHKNPQRIFPSALWKMAINEPCLYVYIFERRSWGEGKRKGLREIADSSTNRCSCAFKWSQPGGV